MHRILSFIITFIFITAGCLTAAHAGENEMPNAVAPTGGANAPAAMEFPEDTGRVVIITADRTSIKDWAQMNTPHLDALASKYSIGLMNCSSGGGNIPENTFLTMGSGVPLRAPGTDDSAFAAGKELDTGTASQIYNRRTGKIAPTGSIIQVDLASIYNMSKNSTYSVNPGTLGTELNRKGIKTAVLGNADSTGEYRRNAVLLAMDNNGVVDAGNIDSSTVIKDTGFPGSMRANYKYLLRAFSSLPRDVGLVVIETGDFTRLEENGYKIMDSRLAGLRRQAAHRWDNFLGEIKSRLNLEKDLLLVVSPTPGGSTVKGENMLTPVLAAGSGIKSGVLYSPATRRPGIIRNTDLLPTILQFFAAGIPGGVTGKTLQFMPGNYSLSSLDNMHEKLVSIHNSRSPILHKYIKLQIPVLVISLLFFFWRKPFLPALLKPVLLAIMSVPAALLVIPALHGASIYSLLFWLFATVILVTIIAGTFKRFGYPVPLLVISFITSTVIVIDLLLGAPLQKSSLMSYDPIVGARFYGLGNEYMGVLVSSTIIAVTALVSAVPRYKRPLLALAAVCFPFVIYVTASPHIGTNVGGTISSTAAFLITLLLLFNLKITPKNLVIVLLAIFAVIAGFVVYDITQPAAQQSHIGRTASLVLSGGPWEGIKEITNIISRKVAVNIKLIQHTIWSRVFLAGAAGLIILHKHPAAPLQLLHRKYPELFRGFTGVIIACITVLVFNDSGIVAAATAMIFGVYPVLYLLLHEFQPEPGPGKLQEKAGNSG